jgi:hypothetical protein
MNDNQLDDLKQFIAASVTQSEGRLRSEIGQLREEMHQEFRTVRHEVADGFLAVGEAIDEIHKQLDEQRKINATVDKRLTRLERRIA